MNGLLRIDDVVDGAGPCLHELLAVLEPEARGLRWAILDLGEVTAADGKDLNLTLVGEQVANSPKGLTLSFADLAAFAARVDHVTDAVFVGCTWPERLPRRSDDDTTVLRKSDMLVAAIDGSLWLVSAPAAVLARIEERFERAADDGLDAIALPARGRDQAETA